MSKKIAGHEVIVHGVEHEQYFQGCGTSFTSYTAVATGIGADAREAFDDALESLAQGDWDVDHAEQWEDVPKAEDAQLPKCDSLAALQEDDESGLWVYVSVRVKGDSDA